MYANAAVTVTLNNMGNLDDVVTLDVDPAVTDIIYLTPIKQEEEGAHADSILTHPFNQHIAKAERPNALHVR